MPQIIKVPQLPWHGPRELELTLPDNWDVEVIHMDGYKRPVLTDDQIKSAIASPIGTPPIRELARGKKEVAILIDDSARVTRAFRIVPHVLRELAEAGIPDANIRFISANGSHGAVNRLDFASKLGEDIVARFVTFNHNCYENCTAVGTTSRGTPVQINTEVFNCDLRIAICSAFPHRMVGFSGGAKMVLPGVSHIDTIYANHTSVSTEPSVEIPELTERYLDMEDAARLAGLDFVIEGIVNEWGENVALYAGDLKEAHLACVNDAKKHYRAPTARDKDIVIANSFCKNMEFTLGMQVARCVRGGGDLVLIGNSPMGIVVHYISGTFGKTIGGRVKRGFMVLPTLNHLIVFSEYPDQHALTWIQEAPNRMLLSRWDDVLKTLLESHPNGASVAVYPSADVVRVDFILKA